MDLTGLVASFDVGPIYGYRPAWFQIEDCRWRESPVQDPLVLAPFVAHPTTLARTLDRAQQDQDRPREALQIYAIQELRQGDRLVYRQREYRVTTILNYAIQGGVWVGLAELVDA